MQPTMRSVLLLTAGLPVALLPSLLAERLWPIWVALLTVTLLLMGLDALLLLPWRRARLEVFSPSRIYIGTEGELEVEVETADWSRGTAIEVLCDLDEDLERQPARTLRVPARGQARISVPLRPKRRGVLQLETLWLRWRGPLGLMRQVHTHPLDLEVEVVPDIERVRATALQFFGSPQAYSGAKTERYIGDGSEFESLRKYVPGLDPRSIDWKSSARHMDLLCRNYRAERNHQVILAFDSGRLMSEPLGEIPRIDHAINSGLLLAYFCLRTGDRVGMCGFDARLRSFLEPQGGVQAFSRLQAESARVEYCTAETNFTLGVLELSARLKRRSLVVAFTDFVDSVTAELMLENLDRLARRHVVLFVALRDPALQELEEAAPRNLRDVNRSVVAANLNRERAVVIRRLRQGGIHVVDVLPEAVSVGLLNRYFEIKRRELV